MCIIEDVVKVFIHGVTSVLLCKVEFLIPVRVCMELTQILYRLCFSEPRWFL